MSFLGHIATDGALSEIDREIAPIGVGAYSLYFSKRDEIIHRAKVAAAQKTRLALKIPYHEWAEALRRDREGAFPTYQGLNIATLLEAYTPRWDYQNNRFVDGPRCAPWASRRARDGDTRDNMAGVSSGKSLRTIRRDGACRAVIGFLKREGATPMPLLLKYLENIGIPHDGAQLTELLQDMEARGLVAIGKCDALEVVAISSALHSGKGRACER